MSLQLAIYFCYISGGLVAVLVKKLRLIFFLSPGTGSTSLSSLLVSEFGGEWIVNETTGKHATPKEVSDSGVNLEDYLCVTTTRHPLDFYISQYHKKKLWPGEHEELQFAKTHSFSEFLDRQIIRQPDGLIHPLFSREADVVFRKECLLKDFNALLKALGSGQVEELPNINVSEGLTHDFSKWYSPEDLQKIFDKHLEHFEKFAYNTKSIFPQFPLDMSSKKIKNIRKNNSDFVTQGSNGWLFLSDVSNQVMSQVNGSYDFKTQWKESWHNEFLYRSEIVKSCGAEQYKLFVAPNTHSVIGEKFLPEFKISSARPSMCLADLLGEHLIVDLSSVLMDFDPEISFCKGDSHWSQYGAYLGYKKICNQLGLDFLDIDDDSFEFKGVFGDLSSKLDPFQTTKNFCFKDNVSDDISKNTKVILNNHVEVTGMVRFFESDNPLNRKSLLLFGDSYSYPLLQVLGATFSRFYFVHSKSFSSALVEILKPDYVISIVAERFLTSPPFHSAEGWKEDYKEKLAHDKRNGFSQPEPDVSVSEVDDSAFCVYTLLEQIYKEGLEKPKLTAKEILSFYMTFFGRSTTINCVRDKQLRHNSIDSLRNEFLTSQETIRKIENAKLKP